MNTKKKHIHFVGIGGIGMSGIATILHHHGCTISGCDPDIKQDTITHLKNLGCAVYHGNNNSACNDSSIDTLVYIPMYATIIPGVMAEITRAQTRNIPVISRAQMLAQLMHNKQSIAIAGSHGKTTTTALVSHILIEAAMDPTVVIGGHAHNIASNARVGKSNFLVAEADESDRSFLQLHPTYAVITTIDLEHLETYANLDDIKQTFKQFIGNLPAQGTAIVCIDDENICSLLPLQHVKTITYALDKVADFYARNIILNTDHSLFTVYTKNSLTPCGTIMLPMPGKHNIANALAAIALAHELAIDFNIIAHSLASFSGIARRFSFCGTYKNAEIFDDYGHHPKEIENTLIVARKRAKNRLIAIFQPHRYTRTDKLWSQFLTTFTESTIDTLIITDIYSAGEYPINTITSEHLARELQLLNPPFTVHYAPFTDDFQHIKQAIDKYIGPNDLLLLLGAGKMHLISQLLVE